MSLVIVRSRRLAKHGDIARVATSRVHELLRYNTILKPSSDEFTTIRDNCTTSAYLYEYPLKTRVRNDESSLSTPDRNLPGFCYLNIIWKTMSLKKSITFSIYQPIKKYLLYSRQ